MKKNKPKLAIIYLTIIFLLGVLTYFVGNRFEVDSYHDFYFEFYTFSVVLYIFLITKDSLLKNVKIRLGSILLLLNHGYDLLTEIAYLSHIGNQFKLTNALLDDGLTSLAFILIAYGLSESNHHLIRLAKTDDLTGLMNRKALKSLPLKEFDLIYFDINGLKEINDTQGHEAGDRLLVKFSRILSECCLKKEYPIRLGGDEFIVLLTPLRAEEFINQLSIMARKLNITFAYGITQATEATIQDALTRADKAMYQMKQQSKSGTGSTKNNTQINL